MKLTDRIPEGVTVDGKTYPLDFDFRNVLRMMETLGNDNLLPDARDYLALKCLTKHPKNVHKVLEAAKAILFEEKPGTGEKITSFEQDAGLIRSAFRQVYGIMGRSIPTFMPFALAAVTALLHIREVIP